MYHFGPSEGNLLFRFPALLLEREAGYLGKYHAERPLLGTPPKNPLTV